MRELLGHTEEARERQGRNTHREREMWGRVGVLVVVVGVLVAACVCGVYADGMPLPFTRVLKVRVEWAGVFVSVSVSCVPL